MDAQRDNVGVRTRFFEKWMRETSIGDKHVFGEKVKICVRLDPSYIYIYIQIYVYIHIHIHIKSFFELWFRTGLSQIIF